ncbi:ATP-binding protein [Streptomyces sp. NBC_01190]|uniref:ATP-binding protein n=1 Tax=Streptomyces sp. NBC_01190 TaxID=2903767 RepID=UPI00386EB940|nr:ATP-binding protein [Streptomyces sp. NBC_01190]
MSLPFPRRIAQAALLLGAAAAPLIGAGAAHAAALPQQGLGGLSNLDGAGLGHAVEGASHQSTTLAAQSGTQAMKSTLPTADRLVGTTARTALPTARQTAQQTAQQTAGKAGDSAGRVLGATTESAGGAVPLTLPNTGTLPLNGIPLG